MPPRPAVPASAARLNGWYATAGDGAVGIGLAAAVSTALVDALVVSVVVVVTFVVVEMAGAAFVSAAADSTTLVDILVVSVVVVVTFVVVEMAGAAFVSAAAVSTALVASLVLAVVVVVTFVVAEMAGAHSCGGCGFDRVGGLIGGRVVVVVTFVVAEVAEASSALAARVPATIINKQHAIRDELMIHASIHKFFSDYRVHFVALVRLRQLRDMLTMQVARMSNTILAGSSCAA